jgi:hypothetical protein
MTAPAFMPLPTTNSTAGPGVSANKPSVMTKTSQILNVILPQIF